MDMRLVCRWARGGTWCNRAGSAGEAEVPTEAGGLTAQGGGENGASPWMRELSCATVIRPSAVCAAAPNDFEEAPDSKPAGPPP